MSIQWNPTKTLGKCEHAYYKLSQRYCPEPAVEEDRWFVEYQPLQGPYDPNGKFLIVEQPFGFKTKEEAIAGAEQNDETTARNLGLR